MKTDPDSLLTLITHKEPPVAAPLLEWRACINAEAVNKQLFESSENGLVRLRLFDGRDYLLSTAYCQRIDEHCVSWWGTLPASPDIRVYLSVVACPGKTIALAGYIHHCASPLTLETLADGTVRIFIPAAGAGLPSHPTGCGSKGHPGTPSPVTGYSAAASEYASLSADPAEPVVIRLLAMYPAKTLKEAGGQTQLQAKMLLGASLASEAFANSRIPARVEMAFQQEDALKGTSDNQGVMGYVNQALKEPDLAKRIESALLAHQADLAVLVTGLSTDGIFGFTPVIPEPPTTAGLTLKSRLIGVALRYKMYPDHPGEMDLMGERNTLTHELGHALGAKHDRITQPDYSGLDPKYDYVRGYVPDDQSFTTVMGYPGKAWGARRLNYFSGPDLTWQGRALGIPVGQPYAADCASFLRLSAQVVAKYKGANASHADLHTLSLAVTPELAGILTPDAPGPYPRDAAVGVKATPRAGSFVFRGWTLDGKSVGDARPAITVKMDREHTLTARFDAGLARHTVTFGASDPLADKSVSVSLEPGADGKYADGITLTASLRDPDPHYGSEHTWALFGWEIDGRYAGSNPELSLRVDGDHVVKARVGRRQHKVTWRTVPDNARELLYVSGYADVIPAYPVMSTPAHAADGQPLRFVAAGDFDHWRVNGKTTAAHFHELNLDCRADTRVEAFFNGWKKALKLTIRTNFFDVFPVGKEFHPWVSWAKSPKDFSNAWQMAYNFDSGPEQTYWLIPETPVTLVAYRAKHMSVNGGARVAGDIINFNMHEATDIYVDFLK